MAAVCDGRADIRLIVGLGNPGREYENSRHNTGFMVIDKLLAGFPEGRFLRRECCRSEVYQGRFRGRELLLQKPMTYMNLSGEAVAPLAAASRIAPENILVVVDDLDLPLGRIRLIPCSAIFPERKSYFLKKLWIRHRERYIRFSNPGWPRR